jgi:hypothetical protein
MRIENKHPCKVYNISYCYKFHIKSTADEEERGTGKYGRGGYYFKQYEQGRIHL